MKIPAAIFDKLAQRQNAGAVRSLPLSNDLVDFSSNDYLGFARSQHIFDATNQWLAQRGIKTNGATGSRLISGNHFLYAQAESMLGSFHQSESALIFNSGYDANVGFFSAVPQKADVILYDALCHASIRDGIRLSAARSFKFAHNDPEDLERLILRSPTGGNIYVATESVFSMDGDAPPLAELFELCEKYGCFPVVDEAHALGVFGDRGAGLVAQLGLQDKVFARVVTFGKALGCHGAAILGPAPLRDYLVNFARSFIYTTGLSPHAVANIIAAYDALQTDHAALAGLRDNIIHFVQSVNLLHLRPVFVYSKSAIQCAIVPGNQRARSLASHLQAKGFDVRAILSPTVPQGQERLRICLHSYNTKSQIDALLVELAAALF